MGGIDHADLGTRTEADADAAVLPLNGRAGVGIGSDNHSAFPEVARLSGGI